MTDRHGRPIAVGAAVRVLKPGSGLKNRVGEVVLMLQECGACRGRPGVNVVGENWSVWAEPGDVEVLGGERKER